MAYSKLGRRASQRKALIRDLITDLIINESIETTLTKAKELQKLADKMAMYKEFYENFVPGDSGYSNLPQLIFVCEDDRHTAETFKEIIKNKLDIPQIKLYFTTDLRQNNDTLENTLIEFKIDEEKTLARLATGAEPTDTVRNILSKAGIMEKFHNKKQGK